MKRILQLAVALMVPAWSLAAGKNSPDTLVTRISVLATGEILLDGRDATMSEVTRALARTKTKKGSVWYYRESGKGEPPPQAIEIFKLIVEKKLPISLSTKPDFSDYVDEKGQPQPRR